MKIRITKDFLLECFTYDKINGKLFWNTNRPENHFTTKRSFKYYLNNRAGKEAGYTRKVTPTLSYRYIRVGVCLLFAHQIVYFIENNVWPEPMIDHLDGDGLNNKVSNLKVCVSKDNQKNTKLYENNKTGISGVNNFPSKSRPYCVWIGNKRLGYFSDFFEACCIRKSAELEEGYSERNGTK